MARPTRLLLTTIPLVFAIIAFIFSTISTTSKEWAVRKQYAIDQNPQNWTDDNVVFTLYRSPFTICTEYIIEDNSNSSTTNTGSSDNPPVEPPYGVQCTSFRPFGFSQTSCELAIAVENDTNGVVGDARQCQQIHYAGNFAIAGTVFIGLGLSMTLAMFIAAMHVQFPPRGDDKTASAGPTEAAAEAHSRRRQRFALMSHINSALLACLAIGVILTVIAQFYGVLAFIMSSPNNADFATKVGNKTPHGPWIQGRALSIFPTLAWGFAIMAGTAALSVWRLPRSMGVL